MRGVINLQYWSGDMQYCRGVMDLITQLGQPEYCEVRVQLSRRWDAPAMLESEVQRWSRWAPVAQFRAVRRAQGWLMSPGLLWQDSLRHIANAYATGFDWVLCLDSDVVPLTPDWLDRLACEWLKVGCPGCFGRMVSVGEPSQHINGGVCLLSLDPWTRGLCFSLDVGHPPPGWDMLLHPAFKKYRGSYGTELVVSDYQSDLQYTLRDVGRLVSGGCCILHGCKNSSALSAARQLLKLPVAGDSSNGV
jgi:hypothetical protein